MFATERCTGSRKGPQIPICELLNPWEPLWICRYFGNLVVPWHRPYIPDDWQNGADVEYYICRSVFVSFGGLLLYLEGPYKKLNPLRIDYLYLLIKK